MMKKSHPPKAKPPRASKLRAVAWLLAGVMTLLGMAAIAQSDGSSAAGRDDCAGDFKNAVDTAMKTHVTIVQEFYDKAAKSMQKAVSADKSNGGGNAASGVLASCLGDITTQDIDISGFIVDFGSIGSLIKGAAEKLVNKALGRACESIGNAAQTAVGSWNDSIQKINEQFNLNQQVYGAVAGAIGNINTTGGSYTNGSGGGATGGVGGQISTPCIPSVTTLCNPDGSSSPRPKPERPFMCAPAPPPRLGFCDCSDGSHPQMVGGQCPLQPANP